MGWDLYSKGEKHYFRVNLHVWPRLAVALECLGADIEKMASDNSGKYVPAATAREWAEAIEKGIDTLRMAIVVDRDTKSGEDWFLISDACGEKGTQDLLRGFYGDSRQYIVDGRGDDDNHNAAKIVIEGYRSHPLKRVEPLREDMRKYLLEFAAFCRRSHGFYQW